MSIQFTSSKYMHSNSQNTEQSSWSISNLGGNIRSSWLLLGDFNQHAFVYHLPRAHPDHHPLLLSTEGSVNRQKLEKLLKFQVTWFEHLRVPLIRNSVCLQPTQPRGIEMFLGCSEVWKGIQISTCAILKAMKSRQSWCPSAQQNPIQVKGLRMVFQSVEMASTQRWDDSTLILQLTKSALLSPNSPKWTHDVTTGVTHAIFL
ncbi:hypothetical protein M9H77_11794 [Catharanthus roseus]|uniref:Uncharacterized protein n=1 Tax=Catharanthus roseus TaxID=4058 RepID=A0ACC0BFN9_CATRO|nr:hypothetical protein M9H77_11794 [Catharanthus roseus]